MLDGWCSRPGATITLEVLLLGAVPALQMNLARPSLNGAKDSDVDNVLVESRELFLLYLHHLCGSAVL